MDEDDEAAEVVLDDNGVDESNDENDELNVDWSNYRASPSSSLSLPPPTSTHGSRTEEQPPFNISETATVLREEALPEIQQKPDPSNKNPLSTVGAWTVAVSDTINDHLIVARSLTMATIGVMAWYGISQTPLFFRYRTVADVPYRYFQRNLTLHGCRLISHARHPATVRCWIRHCSPVERIMPRSLWEGLMRYHPASAIRKERYDQRRSELLQVELVSVVPPPEAPVSDDSDIFAAFNTSTATSQAEALDDWFRHMAESGATVSCQFLGRRLPVVEAAMDLSVRGQAVKRSLHSIFPDWAAAAPSTAVSSSSSSTVHPFLTPLQEEQQVALVRLFIRPHYQYRRQDVGTMLVRQGLALSARTSNAAAAEAIGAEQQLAPAVSNTEILLNVNTAAAGNSRWWWPWHRTVWHHLDELVVAQREAIRQSRGAWQSPWLRQQYPDLVQDVEFEANATYGQKLWKLVVDKWQKR
jgi:hypothetical protein